MREAGQNARGGGDGPDREEAEAEAEGGEGVGWKGKGKGKGKGQGKGNLPSGIGHFSIHVLVVSQRNIATWTREASCSLTGWLWSSASITISLLRAHSHLACVVGGRVGCNSEDSETSAKTQCDEAVDCR